MEIIDRFLDKEIVKRAKKRIENNNGRVDPRTGRDDLDRVEY